jgi:DNA-binding MarR family transcriptional regulator
MELYVTLRQSYVFLEAAVARALRSVELRPEEFNVLRAADGAEGTRMTEVARRVLIDDSTTTRVVDALERKRLVVRVPDQTDRRVRRVRRTAAGEHVLREAERACTDAVEDASSGLTCNERAELLRLLSAFRERL